MRNAGIFILLLICALGKSQSANDTVEILRLMKSLNGYSKTNPAKAIEIGKSAEAILHHQMPKLFYVGVYRRIGECYTRLGDFKNAITYLNRALSSADPTDDARMGDIYNALGNMYATKGDFKSAIENQLKAISSFEKTKSSMKMAGIKQNLAICYSQTGKHKESLKYFKEVITTLLAIETDSNRIAEAYINTGIAYIRVNQADSCLLLYKKAFRILAKSGNSSSLALLLNNMAEVSFILKDYRSGSKYIERSLNMMRATGDNLGVILTLNNAAQLLLTTGKFEEAERYALLAYRLADSVGHTPDIIISADKLSKIYAGKGDFKKAYEYSNQYTELSDSTRDTENIKSIAEISSRYESEKKEKEIELLNKDKQLQNSQLSKEKSFRYFIIAVAVFVFIIALLLFYSLKNKQKTNGELDEKNKKIQQAYALIENKQKEILDSIHYAKRIQQSLLPSHHKIHKSLNKLKKN